MNDELLKQIYDYIDDELDANTRATLEERMETDEELAAAVHEARDLESAIASSFPKRRFAMAKVDAPKVKKRSRFVPLAAAAAVILCGGLAWAAVETGVWDALIATVSNDSEKEISEIAEETEIIESSNGTTSSAPNSEEPPVKTVQTSKPVGGVLNIRVVNTAGDPIPRATVEAVVHDQWYMDDESSQRSTTNANGYATLDLSGVTRLSVTAAGYAQLQQVRLPYADSIDLEVELTPLQEVTGQVFNPDGSPLEGAMVYSDPAERAVRTDADGRFRVAAERSHPHYSSGIVVRHPEYAQQFARLTGDQLTVWMSDGYYVDLTVVEGSSPVAGAEVMMNTEQVHHDFPKPIVFTTDDQGKALVGPLNLAHHFDLRIEHPDGRTTHVDKLTTLPIRGEATSIRESFPFPMTHTIEGQITFEGEPVPFQDVWIFEQDRHVDYSCEADADGRISVAVASGSYQVQAMTNLPDGTRLYAGERFETFGSSSVIPVDLKLQKHPQKKFRVVSHDGEPALTFRTDVNTRLAYAEDESRIGLERHNLFMSDDFQWGGFPVPEEKDGDSWTVTLDVPMIEGVSGRVVDNQGNGIEGVTIASFVNRSPYEKTTPMTDEKHRPGQSIRTLTDADGQYTLGPLMENAEYRVDVGKTGFTMESRVNGDVLVTAAQGTAVEDITLIPEDAFLEGVVRYDTGRPLPLGAEIRIDHPNLQSKMYQSPSGRFRLQVAHGDYIVSAALNPAERSEPIVVSAPGEPIEIVLPDPQSYLTQEQSDAMLNIEAATNSLKQLGVLFKMFAIENEGEILPSLDTTYGSFAMKLTEVYPEYLTDLRIIAPLLGEDSVRTVYMGYAITSEVDGLAFLDAYESLGPAAFTGQDIDVGQGRGTGGNSTVYRLRDGIERMLVTDVNDPSMASMGQSMIPIMWELPRTRGNRGGLVLFLDGHVEWLDYPGRFPMTEAFNERLDAIVQAGGVAENPY